MELQFLPADHLESLKNNVEENLYLYNNKENQWVYNLFGNTDPFKEFKKEVPDFKLNMDSDRPEETDVRNVVIIYKNLMSLTDIQACDERLWAGLTHGTFYDYMHYRWGGNTNYSVSNTKARYFFAHGKRKSLITNSISRLWWIGKYTYDEQYENPFELLDFFRNDFGTKALYLFSSNISSDEKIRKAILIALNNFEKNGYKVNRKIFNQVMIYLNVKGGLFLLDYFSKEELVEMIEDYIKQIIVGNNHLQNSILLSEANV